MGEQAIQTESNPLRKGGVAYAAEEAVGGDEETVPPNCDEDDQTGVVAGVFVPTLLQRAVVGALVLLSLLAATILGASFSGFQDNENSGDWSMIVAAALGVVVWATFLVVSLRSVHVWTRSDRSLEHFERLLAHTRNLSIVALILSIVTGILLALFALASCGPLWLFSFYHYSGLVGAVLSLTTWFGLPPLCARFGDYNPPRETRHARPIRRWVVLAAVFCSVVLPWGAFWLAAWIGFRNDALDETLYPDQATSPYKLPFPQGEKSFLVQGNNGRWSHTNTYSQYAYDFRRACGAPVVASRSGTVVLVEDGFQGNIWTGDDTNNEIVIEHPEDETTAHYVHLKQGSALVQEGDSIAQGQPIASSGNVGRSSAPHLHFGVNDAYSYRTIPVSFSDVVKDDGIPRSLHLYRSDNQKFDGEAFT